MINNNFQTSEELQKATKTQTNADSIPSIVANQFIPTLESNPRLVRGCDFWLSAVITNATSATLYTVPTGKRLIITAASLSLQKDATATTTGLRLSVTSDKTTTGGNDILVIAGLTLTAGYTSTSLSYPHPVICEPGSVVSLGASTNVANFYGRGNVVGYLEEV